MTMTMTSAERIDAIIAFVKAETAVEGNDLQGAMKRLAKIVPDATREDIETALLKLAEEREEEAARLDGEREVWAQIEALLGQDSPKDKPIGEIVQAMIDAGDPRGQQVLDLLNDPRMPQFVEVEREIRPLDLVADMAAGTRMFTNWFAGRVRWNREMNNEIGMEPDDGVESIDLSTKSLDQSLEFLPALTANLEGLGNALKHMDLHADVRDLALRYAAVLPEDVNGRVALRAFANAIMLAGERRPDELRVGPITAASGTGDDGGAAA